MKDFANTESVGMMKGGGMMNGKYCPGYLTHARPSKFG